MFARSYHQPVRILLVLLALVTFLLAAGVSAQTTPPPANQVEFIGVVQAMTMESLQINNQVVNITRAEIKTAVQIGQPVKIEGTLLADGTIIAREVKAVEDDDDPMLPGEFEVVGVLTGMDATTVTVGGQTVDISRAELYPGLALGAVIKLKVFIDPASGLWTAREVRPDDSDLDDDDSDDNGNDNADDNGNDNANDNSNDNDDDNSNDNSNDNDDDDDNDNVSDDDSFKLIGTLEEIGEGYVVIAGRRISTVNARLDGPIVLGARVEARLRVVNGELTARRLRLAQRSGSDRSDDQVVIPANCVPAQPAGWTSYTVQSGDTLSGIADRSDSSLRDLIFFNCISNPRLLTVGTVLFVPRPPDPANFSNDNDDDNYNDNSSNDNDDDHNDNSSDDNGNDNDDNDNSSNDNDDDHNDNSSDDDDDDDDNDDD